MTTANSNNGKPGDTGLLSHVLSRIEKERDHSPSGERAVLGQVTAADTERGVTVHLRREQPVELLRQGQFVVVEGKHVRFFGTINSFRLATTDPTVGMDPPDTGSPLVRDTLSRSTTYAECNVRMALELSTEGTPRPARTIPGPFSQAFSAGTSDYGAVFGHEDKDHFVVGYPRELDENVAHTAPICVSLKRFVERSNGIFGRSGTGKSVLARLLLSGLISRNSCVNLVFDMHSEYASEKRLESGLVAKGLRELFGKSRVALYTIDEEASRRGGGADGAIRIPLSDITIDDIEALSSELKLGEGSAAIITARQAHRKMGNGWIERLINMSSEEMGDFAKETGAHQGSLEGLKRKLETIADLGFVTRSGQKVGTGIEGLISDLKSGKHVILMFGQYRSTLAYMLVANILTKRIHNAWVSWSEDHEDGKASEPKPLMITIEEAHKFLGRDSATIFGTIAREMRKYLVTLMVVDQRPSGIDDEVMSQLGTRITALLNDDRDIDSVFTGIRGGSQLKNLLATLDSKQEVMLMGHAVPMEVVLRVRNFDTDFYNALKSTPKAAQEIEANVVKAEKSKLSLEDLFGD